MTPHMEVDVLEVAGVLPALLGLGLSYGKVNHIEVAGSMLPVAQKLCGKGGGHDKFLESIMLWLDVKAPRYWWAEADTYRISSKQSESTMHTLKKGVKADNFEVYIGGELLWDLNKLLINGDHNEAKAMLPEGFLQRRIWCLSLKTFVDIRRQRINHKLPHWKMFIKSVDVYILRHDIIGDIWSAHVDREQGNIKKM